MKSCGLSIPPWQTKAKWRTGVIPPETGRRLGWIWVVCLLLFAISIPAFSVLQAAENGNPLVLLGLLVPLSGFGALAFAIFKTFRHLRYGRSRLELGTLPGVIGGQLSGKIILNYPPGNWRRLELRLRCIRNLITGGGGNRSVIRELLWESEKSCSPKVPGDDPRSTVVSFSFQIPFSCPPYSDLDRKDTITWTLSVSGKKPGPGMRIVFSVPVFQTDESDASVGEDLEFFQRVEHASSPLPEHIKRGTDSEGNPTFRVSLQPRFARILAAFLGTILSSGIAVFGFMEGETLFCAVFFGLSLAGLGLFLYMLGTRDITVTPSGLIIRKGMGPFFRTTEISKENIRAIEVIPSGCTANEFFRRVDIRMKDNHKPYTVGSDLPGKVPGEWLAHHLRRALGFKDMAR